MLKIQTKLLIKLRTALRNRALFVSVGSRGEKSSALCQSPYWRATSECKQQCNQSKTNECSFILISNTEIVVETARYWVASNVWSKAQNSIQPVLFCIQNVILSQHNCNVFLPSIDPLLLNSCRDRIMNQYMIPTIATTPFGCFINIPPVTQKASLWR